MWAGAVTSYTVNKRVTTARMLSGRFRCGSLLRHFNPDISGICELCGKELEDIPHIILPRCPNLLSQADILRRYAENTLATCPTAFQLFSDIVVKGKDDYLKVQFFVDPSVIPAVIAAAQVNKHIMEAILTVTTTWCYSMNRTRCKLLGI